MWPIARHYGYGGTPLSGMVTDYLTAPYLTHSLGHGYVHLDYPVLLSNLIGAMSGTLSQPPFSRWPVALWQSERFIGIFNQPASLPSQFPVLSPARLFCEILALGYVARRNQAQRQQPVGPEKEHENGDNNWEVRSPGVCGFVVLQCVIAVCAAENI
jgi:hypothetical protein